MEHYFLLTTLVIFALAGGVCPKLTFTPPEPEIDSSCSDEFCAGKWNGVHPHPRANHHYVMCTDERANCSRCPTYTSTNQVKFSSKCLQCVHNLKGDCPKEPKKPPVMYPCPDICASKSYKFSGNIADPNEDRHFILCSHGTKISCITCPLGLFYSEKLNRCA